MEPGGESIQDKREPKETYLVPSICRTGPDKWSTNSARTLTFGEGWRDRALSNSYT